MSITFNVELDRSTDLFNINIDYAIQGYLDPETLEYFSQTSWNYVVTDLGSGLSGGLGGYGYDMEFVQIAMGFGPLPELYRFSVDFVVFNSFSGEQDSITFEVFNAATTTSSQTIDGTEGIDIILGGSEGDTLRGLGNTDVIDGGGGDDLIEGGDGDDLLNGGDGSDEMRGGAGNDTYFVDDAGDQALEDVNAGTDAVYASVSFTLAGNVEKLTLLGFGDIDGTGNSSANRIDGNEGDNVLSGLIGADDLRGGGGNDILLGGAGNDRLDGGAGFDRLRGGGGDDTYVLTSSADRVIEVAEQGIDTVELFGFTRYSMADNVEKLVVLETGGPGDTPGLRAVGNSLHNAMTGGTGDDVFDGGLGNDSIDGGDGDDLVFGGGGSDLLRGGAGVDTLNYAASTSAVTVRLDRSEGSGGDASGDDIRGFENVVGSSLGDVIVGYLVSNVFWGGAGDDSLAGSHGDDILIGGSGADTLNGGGDYDLVSYAGSAAGAVTVDLELDTASGGDAQGDTISNFEGAIGGQGDDTLTGDNGGNRLSGGEGIDTINGGDGDDIINGGAGGDILLGGGGFDMLSYAGSLAAVFVSFDDPNLLDDHAVGGDASDDVISGFEGVVGGFGDDDIRGGIDANRLFGGNGDDKISGRNGNDVIGGGAGADVMNGGSGIDTLSYADSALGVTVNLGTMSASGGDAAGDDFADFENLTGSAAGDYLVGNSGDNRNIGGKGFDALDGGAGNDILTGGENGDSFIFGPGFGNDTVTDFAIDDRLAISLGAGFDSFAEVMAMASAAGTGGVDTVFDFGSGGTLTLAGVSIASLSAEYFTF